MLDLLREPFVWRALLGGLGLALAAGPLGCVIVWRRMAYFGDSLSHSALLGVALGLALGLNLNLALLAVFTAFALLLVWLEDRQGLATDTVLGILAHSGLALGLVALSFMQGVRVDLLGYLFGDILAVTWVDLAWIWGGAALVLAVLVWLWPRLLALALHEELARAEGLPVLRVRLAFMFVIALTIVLAMKIVGVLLITALLIIPPAAARAFARTPEQMALLAVGTGALAVLGGLGASLLWDTPSGPSVVVAAALLFALAQTAAQTLAPRLRAGRAGGL